MFALISTEDMEELNQIMVKQLKNRYNDPTVYKRFVLGIDRQKMRLYDCEQGAQDNIIDAAMLLNHLQMLKNHLKDLKFNELNLLTNLTLEGNQDAAAERINSAARDKVDEAEEKVKATEKETAKTPEDMGKKMGTAPQSKKKLDKKLKEKAKAEKEGLKV